MIKKYLVIFVLFIATSGFYSNANAVIIETYFGWNFVGGSNEVSGLAEADLLAFTYSGSSGLVTVSPPAFPSYNGMPDGIGLAAVPTYTTTPGSGDGETTRTLGATIPIDWGATAAPYLDILIKEYVFEVAGLGVFTADFGPSASTWYQVGLIPPGSDTELCSTLFTAQGDIYDSLACIGGNPVSTAFIIGDPTSGGQFTGEGMQVIFAASSAVPLPPAVWLFGSGLIGLVGLSRYKKVA